MADDVVEKKIEELAGFIEDTNRHADITGEYAQEAEDKINEAMGSAIEMENRLDEIERQFTTLINVVEDGMVSADAVGLLEDAKARMEVVASQLQDHDDAEVRDEMAGLQSEANRIQEWLNENYHT